MKCSVPVNFAFTIEVLKPHPYFKITPSSGEIPANGSIDIQVSFTPITLGTCITMIRVFISQHNFEPYDCMIDARAVSGMIETKELQHVESRLANKMLQLGNTLNSNLKTFQMTDNNITNNTGDTQYNNNSNSNKISQQKSKRVDPVLTMLQKTFKTSDIGSTLSNAIIDNPLLNSKVTTIIETGSLHGTKKIVGDLKATQPLHPRGIGSGNVFDAGAEWVSQKNSQTNRKMKTISESDQNMETVEGLRIPRKLDSVAAVNFVITQEVGKLKPKDLKIAIEKNRAEKKKQAIEQQKIRESGGLGATIGGGLDLRAILSEEMLNVDQGDAFKRQLREMAFLADVEDVKHLEEEKAFRVSEEYLGTNMLSEDDINVILQQRKSLALHQKNSMWREIQAKKHSEYFTPNDDVKSGAPKVLDLNEIIKPKSFDVNTNDVWSKRMSTLRKLMNCVSTWIFRERISKRYLKLKFALNEAGVTNKETCKAFVATDNNNQRSKSASLPITSKITGSGAVGSNNSNELDIIAASKNLAMVYCSLPNQAMQRKVINDVAILQTFEPTVQMAKRVLFPKFVDDEVSTRRKLEPMSIDQPFCFDDRTFFEMIPRSEFLDNGYINEPVPLSPMFYPPVTSNRLKKQIGCAEEKSIRSCADVTLNYMDINTLIESQTIFPPAVVMQVNAESTINVSLHVNTHTPAISQSASSATSSSTTTVRNIPADSILKQYPAWLTSNVSDTDPSISVPASESESIWDDVDPFQPRPQLRTYLPVMNAKETDSDWMLRPTNEVIKFDVDNTLRTK